MIKKTISIFALTLVLVLTNVSMISADGGYFPEPGYWVRPGQQRAVIFYEGGIETLILTSGFQGDAKNLVWIVPTPYKPEITKANEEIFTNVAELTRPQYDRDFRFGYGAVLEAAETKSLGVAVVESKKVDYYDVTTLVAIDSDDLVTWFNENNYSYPEEYSYVLQHYIDKRWFFNAIKVSPEAQGAMDVIQDFKEGHPTPIKMVFTSDKIVFPLKISSIDFEPQKEVEYDYYYGYGRIPINLYVIADDKYEASNFNVEYANWVKKHQIEELGYDEDGDPLIEPTKNKYFITSLYGNFAKSQMDDDIYLRQSNSNNKVNAGLEISQILLRSVLMGIIVLISWILTPIGILFIVGSFILFLSSHKGWRITAWIFQWLALAVTLLLAASFFLLAAFSNVLTNYIFVSILITSLIILIAMVGLMIIETKHKKKSA